MKFPVYSDSMKTTLIAEYDVALLSGTIRLYATPTWPCHRKDDMSVDLDIILTTANGVRYKLTEIVNE